jgi:hypothetical protein
MLAYHERMICVILLISFSHLANNLISSTFSEDTFVHLDRLLYL